MFSINQIQLLNGSNFKDWREQVELYLGMQNLDVWMYEDKPADLTPTSTKDQKDEYHKWVRANRVSLNTMKATMTKTIKGSIPEKDLASEYLAAIAEKFKENDKAEAAQLMHTFDTLKYTGSGNVREHIMKLIDIAAQLKDLNMTLADDYVVQHALNSLPQSFSQLKTSYLAQKTSGVLMSSLPSVLKMRTDRRTKKKSLSTLWGSQNGRTTTS